MMYAGIFAAMMLLGAGLGVEKGLTPQRSEELTQSFEKLSEGVDEAAAATAKSLVLELAKNPESFHTFLSSYFLTHSYTPGLATFWNGWVSGPEEAQMDAAMASGACAAEALTASLGQTPPDLVAAQALLQWLEYLASGFDKKGMDSVANACRLAFSTKRIEVAGLFGEPSATAPVVTPAATPDMGVAAKGAATTPVDSTSGGNGAAPAQEAPAGETPALPENGDAAAPAQTAPSGETPALPGAPAPPETAAPQPAAELAMPTMDQMRIAMQTCLTLSRFKDPTTLGEWVTLSPDKRVFLSHTGIFVFDRGVLSGRHLQCLDSLLRCFPVRPPVSAALVSEALGARTAEWNLSSPMGVMELPALDLSVLSMPEDFSPRLAGKAAPEFTLSAAGQLFYSLQYDAFANRPQLAEWRNSLLMNAGLVNARYLRRSVGPAYFQSSPDDFLPGTAYLWFLDSARAFETAIDLLMALQGEPLSSLLLVADVLSGGSDTTLLFSTDESGVISSQTTAIRRAMAAPGIAVVNAIAINGRWYEFSVDGNGVVRGFLNSGDGMGYGEGEGEMAMQTPPVTPAPASPPLSAQSGGAPGNGMGFGQQGQGYGQAQGNGGQQQQVLPYQAMQQQQGYGAQQYYGGGDGGGWTSAY